MNLELIGKKALVSAGHKGIGLFIARRLLEEGVAVAIVVESKRTLIRPSLNCHKRVK